MIYAITRDMFARVIHHKAKAELEKKTLEARGSDRSDLLKTGFSWTEYLGVEDAVAPKSLLTVDGTEGTINVSGVLLPTPDPLFAFWEIPQTAYRDLATSLREADADSNVERLTLVFDTPGGAVKGLEAVANIYKNLSTPTRSLVAGQAASAGYWLASQGDTIETNEATAGVGSIGVVVDTVDFSGWEEEVGIKSISITNRASGDKRPDLSTSEGVAILQDELDQIFEVFRDTVVEGRAGKNGFKAENVEALAGRVVAARRASELGLIDNINLLQQEADNMDGKDGNVDATVETPTVDATEPTTAPAAVTEPAVESVDAGAEERARISGLLALGGVQLSATLTEAITGGTSKADYAVATLEAQNNKTEATQAIPAIPSAHVKQEATNAASDDEAQEKKLSNVLDQVLPKA